VFGREQVGELVHILFDQRLEVEHHPGAALGIGHCPSRLRGLRGSDGAIEIGLRPEIYLGLDLPGIGVEHVAGTSGATAGRARDEMVDGAHGQLSWASFGSMLYFTRQIRMQGYLIAK
jgi:hypothetical protein